MTQEQLPKPETLRPFSQEYTFRNRGDSIILANDFAVGYRGRGRKGPVLLMATFKEEGELTAFTIIRDFNRAPGRRVRFFCDKYKITLLERNRENNSVSFKFEATTPIKVEEVEPFSHLIGVLKTRGQAT